MRMTDRGGGLCIYRRGSACLSVCMSLCCLSEWGAVNACPGNRVGVKEKSWGAGSELLAGVVCWAGCAVCFCSQADRERRRMGRERSRENAAGWTRAIVSVWKPVRTSKTLHSENKSTVSSLFLPPFCSLGINLCSVSQWYDIGGFQGLRGEEAIQTFCYNLRMFWIRFFWHPLGRRNSLEYFLHMSAF